MSKLGAPRLPLPPVDADTYMTDLYRSLMDYLRDVEAQVNMISEGRISGYYQAQTAQPTGIVLSAGDFIPHSDPVQAGGGTTADPNHVVLGWVCITDGTASAATTLEARALTG